MSRSSKGFHHVWTTECRCGTVLGYEIGSEAGKAMAGHSVSYATTHKCEHGDFRFECGHWLETVSADTRVERGKGSTVITCGNCRHVLTLPFHLTDAAVKRQKCPECGEQYK